MLSQVLLAPVHFKNRLLDGLRRRLVHLRDEIVAKEAVVDVARVDD